MMEVKIVAAMPQTKVTKKARAARKRLFRVTIERFSVMVSLVGTTLFCVGLVALFFVSPSSERWIVGLVFLFYGLLPLIRAVRWIPRIGQTVVVMNASHLQVLDRVVPWDSITSVNQSRHRLSVTLDDGTLLSVSDVVMSSDFSEVYHQLQARVIDRPPASISG